MRRLRSAWVIVLCGLGSCPRPQDENNEAEAVPTPVDLPAPDESKPVEDLPPEEAKPSPVVVDDANRFVQEDLDAFVERYPDAVRKDDKDLFESCRAETCLETGASKTLGPFLGAGVRYLVPLWLRGCLTGSGEACLMAGRTYQGSQYSTGDPVHEGLDDAKLQARFRLYIDRACKLDETKCEQWADFTLGDENPPSDDVTRAIEALKTGCARKDHGSCAALARHSLNYPEKAGEPAKWWQEACDAGPKPPSRSCSRLAEALLATGRAADRTRAEEVLGGACEPGSDAWEDGCKGDPETGEEACGFPHIANHGKACLALGTSFKPGPALRLNAALCVESLLNEHNAVGEQACAEATRLAKKAGKPAKYRNAIARRNCLVEEMTCLSTTFELSGCEDKRVACQAKF